MEPKSDHDLLKAAIARSGLSDRQFAMQIIEYSERTVRRWLAGGPVDPKAVKRMRQYLSQRELL